MLEKISVIVFMASLCVMVIAVMISEATMLSAKVMVIGAGMFMLGILGLMIDALLQGIDE